MTTFPHILVEHWAGYDAAAARYGDPQRVAWHTTSPLVLEHARVLGLSMQPLEAAMSQEDLNRLGAVSLSLAKRLAAALDATPGPAGMRLGEAVLPQLKLMLAPLLVRATLGQRWMDAVRGQGTACAVAGRAALSPVSTGFVRFDERDTLFAALVARSGCSGQIPLIDYTPARPPEDREPEPPAWQRLAWRASGWSKLCFGAWRRLAGARPIRLPGATRGDILLFRDNELIKESFLTLLRQGYRLRQLRLPAAWPSPGAVAASGPAERLEQAFDAEASLHGLAGPLISAAGQIAAERLRAWMPMASAAAESLQTIVPSARQPALVLTNGLTDPVERLAYQALRKAGWPVVAVQHGGSTGLTHVHEGVVELADVNSCQGYLAYHETTLAFFRARLGDRMPKAAAVGAPEVTRRRIRPLAARRAARRLLGLSASERVVMYVTNTFQGNGVMMPHGHLDTHYWPYLRRVAVEVFGRLPATCLIKLYARRRGEERHPLRVCPLPGHVRILQELDFRHIRSAADVVVLDVPYSTLGWALGADVPTIFLDLPFNPLRAEIVPAAEAALFRIDASAPAWDQRLLALLTMPHAALAAQWLEKARARDLFLCRHVFGPAGRPSQALAGFVRTFTEQVAVQLPEDVRQEPSLSGSLEAP